MEESCTRESGNSDAMTIELQIIRTSKYASSLTIFLQFALQIISKISYSLYYSLLYSDLNTAHSCM